MAEDPDVPLTMKCLVYDFNAPSGLSQKHFHPYPKLTNSSSVICKVHACGVNPVDAKYVIGDKLPESWMNFSAKLISKHTPGFDFAGIVVEVPQTQKNIFSGFPGFWHMIK